MKRYFILYVDDDELFLDLSKIFLEKNTGFKVEFSTSAMDAMDKLGRGHYDIIISDYQMPGSNGIEFLKNVRSSYGDIPFILFTGRGREEVVIDAINNGANFYIQKGGDPGAQYTELAHKIRTAVDKKRAEDQLIDSQRTINRISAGCFTNASYGSRTPDR